jgi:ubiquinone/menaquinone biosynthesis C-methylase UbiE
VVPGAQHSETVERNIRLFEGPFGSVYSFYMEREPLSRLIARVVWGGDIRPFYASMEAITRIPDGATIVDAPCGAGVAFRALRPGQRVRYLAIDISPRMLMRARDQARARGLERIEFVQADATSIPVEGGGADLFLSYFGLHCLPDPAAAVREIGRCLRPGGRVVGSTVTSGRSLRHRLLLHPERGPLGPMGDAEDLRRWLEAAELERPEIETSGAFAYFTATRR